MLHNLQDNIINKIGAQNTAIIYWILASMLWVIGFTYGNQHNIDVFYTNYFRGLGLLFFNLPRTLSSNYQLIPQESVKYVYIRHFLLGSYSFIFAAVQFYIPLTVVHTIYSSGPLLVNLLDYFINGAMLTPKQMIGAAIAFVGVLLIANGNLALSYFDQTWTFQSHFQYYKTDSAIIKTIISFVLVLATFGWAYAVIVARKMKQMDHYQANFNLGVILIVFTGLLYPFSTTDLEWYQFIYCILFQSIPLAFCQAFFMSALLISKKTGIISMVGYVGVVFSYFISMFRYGQKLNFICLSGTIFVALGVYRVIVK